MGTTLVNPGGGFNTGLGQINSAFGQIYNMFGGNPSGSGSPLLGGGSGPFGGAPQPTVSDPLTAQERATGNLAGQMAPTAFQTGQNLLGTGLGLTQGGTGIAQGGLDVMGTGLGTLQPSIDFYTKLLSGDPTATTQALAPTAANISAITSGATDQASRGMPAGGYRASTMAGLPFAQASQVGNAALQLQPAAAQALGQLGGEQAQIGQGMAGVGENLAGLGAQWGGLGTTMTGQGLQGALGLYNALINKQNVNQQSTPLTAFDQFASGLKDMTGVATGIANIAKACWIAEAIYGVDDLRTHLVRAYLNGPFRATTFGRCVMSLYLRFGRAVAAQVRRHGWVKRLFRPLFDRALRSACSLWALSI